MKESRVQYLCAHQTREEQLQEKRVEKMMRAAAKDVHKIRGQSRKEVPEVQTFRWEELQIRTQHAIFLMCSSECCKAAELLVGGIQAKFLSQER